jgi:putative resolvase
MKVGIGEASKILGVSIETLRRWEHAGKIKSERTPNGHRRYDVSKLIHKSKTSIFETRKTMAYARVSSHDQKEDLERQKRVLEMYCASQGWQFEIVSDLGSGMNYQKKGLKKLINEILSAHIGRLVVTHKDRLLRFGAELIFSICAAKEVEVVIINEGDDTSFEEDLAKDVLEIIIVFSARLYVSRSRKNQKLIEGLKKAVDDVEKS